MLFSSFNDVLNPPDTFLLNFYSLVVAIVIGIDGFKIKTKEQKLYPPKKKSKNNGKEPWFVSS